MGRHYIKPAVRACADDDDSENNERNRQEDLTVSFPKIAFCCRQSAARNGSRAFVSPNQSTDDATDCADERPGEREPGYGSELVARSDRRRPSGTRAKISGRRLHSAPSREYHWDHFDVVRAENGRIKEHWDEAVINPPQPACGN
jgi:hypothetical protein